MIYLAFVSGKQILGYYVADDEELCHTPTKALIFDHEEQARRAATLANKQWALPEGQSFIAMRSCRNGRSERV